MKLWMCCCFVLLFLATDTALAYPEGWQWYNEPPLQKPIKKAHPNTPSKNLYEKQLVAFRHRLKNRLAKAILYPNEKNVMQYIEMQNALRRHALRFSQVWRKVLLDYPSLSYAIAHPDENNAQHVLYTERSRKADQAIQHAAKTDGLFFFYRGNNLLDQTLAPIIERFCERYHLSLIPISVDHHRLNTLAHSRFDHGQTHKMGVHYFPALFLVNPTSKRYAPLAYGFITQDELKARFLALATNFREGE